MRRKDTPGPEEAPGFWIDLPAHRDWLARDADRQFAFFAASRAGGAGFRTLAPDGTALPDSFQELHTTTRLVHAYALGHMRGAPGADRIMDHGLEYLNKYHRDATHGGYLWALDGEDIADDRKLAYGHVFVLLAAASAFSAGHPGAAALLADISEVLDQRFWEEANGLFADEWERDWSPYSDYRGMNANMHGAEALLAAYEATGESVYLQRAGRILDFFTARIAPENGWRVPEHYTETWQIDRHYSGHPMFRPPGTTPGHSFELARLLLQHWDLSGRPENDAPARARHLVQQALDDGWAADGGFVYTLKFDGSVGLNSRFWWPVTEAIGAVAALIKLERNPKDELWYRRLWRFADAHFIDHEHGGWFPEIDTDGNVTSTLFRGKPDIYHALQASLFPLDSGISRHMTGLSKENAMV